MPRYSEQQKRIVELCRQYRGITYEFDNDCNGCQIYDEYNCKKSDGNNVSDCIFGWVDIDSGFEMLRDWLAKNATPKGRRGSGTKPRNKTASISFRFTESEVANLDALAVRLKTNRTDAMNVAVATMLDSVSGQSPE